MTRKQDNRSTREVTTAQLRAATRPLRGGTVRRAARRAHAAAWRACDANAANVCLEAYRSPRGRPAGWPRAVRTAGGHGDDGGVRGPWTRLRVCAARVTSTTGVAFQARAACEQAARQRRSCTARARAGRRGAWAANEHGLAACAAMHLSPCVVRKVRTVDHATQHAPCVRLSSLHSAHEKVTRRGPAGADGAGVGNGASTTHSSTPLSQYRHKRCCVVVDVPS